MIKTPERIRLPSITGDNIEVHCNWNKDTKGEYLKLVFNGQEAIIPTSSLAKVAFWTANEEEQVDMIPTQSIQVRHLKKDVTIQLNKDMRAGSYLTIPVEFKIPLNKLQDIPIIS